MKKLLTLGLLIIFFCLGQQVLSQEKEKITQAVTDYFFLERENIHVHLNKSIFISNEKIWFKGYVYHRKNNAPFFPTTNVFATLMDSDGRIISKQLVYASAASFSGSFDLGNSFKTGKYYLQFYTNWMNNFSEDESAVYEVSIINQETGAGKGVVFGKPLDIAIAMTPEGGAMISGISNTIGISVLGCDDKTAGVTEAEIVDHTGKTVKKVAISPQGYGKFETDAATSVNLKVVVTYNGQKYEQSLPTPLPTGIALDVNSYTSSNTIIKLRTNKTTLEILKGKPVFMVIHKDNKAIVFELPFEGYQTELVLPVANKDLFEGLNTIRILDSSLNQLAERMIYLYGSSLIKLDLSKVSQVSEDNARLIPDMNASIAILPQGTIATNESYDIYGDFLISPYLENNEKINGRYYLSESTRGKKYELDLFLLNQKSKYHWNTILNNPPKSTNSFDIGLSLKGTLDQNLNNKKNYKIRVSSPSAMIDESFPIDEHNQFIMDNLIVADSTKLTFTLFEKGQKKQQVKLIPEISNNLRKFNKPFRPRPSCQLMETDTTLTSNLPSYIEKVIRLEEVTVTATGPKLKYGRGMGNSQLRAYKISESDSKSFFYILDFIRYHGFDVENSGARVNIWGRTTNTINGQRTTPMVYVDNMPIMSFDQLLGIQTSDIDEFYVNQHAAVPSVNNKMGMIRIYMKRDFSHWDKKKPSETSFIIKDGFKKIWPFSNAAYASYYGRGFDNFGLLDWQPLVTTDEQGLFDLTVPFTAQGNIKIVIEGMSSDGRLFSEVRILQP